MLPPTNEEGTLHMHINGSIPEAAELKAHLEGMQGKNTDHAGSPVFNPAVSKAQFKAMEAAAHGHSTLGIPAGVGKDFVHATKNPGRLPANKHG
jgi:hypothetical protein